MGGLSVQILYIVCAEGETVTFSARYETRGRWQSRSPGPDYLDGSSWQNAVETEGVCHYASDLLELISQLRGIGVG